MSRRILVINDEESILELFQLALGDVGYEVHTSEEIMENLADVESLKPDLIILDLKIGMQQEGWRMMQRLRMYAPTQKIPLLLCTAALNEVREQEDTLLDKGIPILYKPFAIDELLQTVQKLLGPSKQDTKDKKTR